MEGTWMANQVGTPAVVPDSPGPDATDLAPVSTPPLPRESSK
jgi:hypothetical protein